MKEDGTPSWCRCEGNRTEPRHRWAQASAWLLCDSFSAGNCCWPALSAEHHLSLGTCLSVQLLWHLCCRKGGHPLTERWRQQEMRSWGLSPSGSCNSRSLHPEASLRYKASCYSFLEINSALGIPDQTKMHIDRCVVFPEDVSHSASYDVLCSSILLQKSGFPICLTLQGIWTGLLL